MTGTVTLPEGVEMVMPGDNTTMSVTLGSAIAMDEGLRFAIREGGRTVGAGNRHQNQPVTRGKKKLQVDTPERNPAGRQHERTENPHQAEGLRPPGGR